MNREKLNSPETSELFTEIDAKVWDSLQYQEQKMEFLYGIHNYLEYEKTGMTHDDFVKMIENLSKLSLKELSTKFTPEQMKRMIADMKKHLISAYHEAREK